jgi:hypothetical protein
MALAAFAGLLAAFLLLLAAGITEAILSPTATDDSRV